MSSKNSQVPKGPISFEDQKKLLKALETLETDPMAYDFLEPVDPIALQIPNYLTIIHHPMDIGTVKKKLKDFSYTTFQDFFSEFELIWNNCRTFNMAGSEICKMADHCEKVFKKQIDKLFKPSSNPVPRTMKRTSEEQSLPKGEMLEMTEKMHLTDKIRILSNDGLTAIVKLIMKECPKGVEEINQEKIQIKIDMIDRRTHELLLTAIDSQLKNPGSDKDRKKE